MKLKRKASHGSPPSGGGCKKSRLANSPATVASSTVASTVSPDLPLPSDGSSSDTLGLQSSYEESAQATLDDGSLSLGSSFKENIPSSTITRAKVTGRIVIDNTLKPLSNIEEIFRDITIKARSLGLNRQLEDLAGRPLRVATACSGTESPMLALRLVAENLLDLDGTILNIEHVFSAEIEPYKQAYIERNFRPPVIFRDITEWSQLRAQYDEANGSIKLLDLQATTAYGARVPVPGDVDVFIIGCSCVDYSSLNNSKAGRAEFKDDGESRATFFALIDYLALWQPKIVIIENVDNAPWQKMQAQVEDVGYAAKVVRADTKSFYLPQTRNRGYMVGVLKHHQAEAVNNGSKLFTESPIVAAVDSWAHKLASFKRLPSSPARDFLLAADDPRLRLLKTGGESREAKGEAPWELCRVRHEKARHEERLGRHRPFTYWSEAGTAKFVDCGDHHWLRTSVTDRVKDLLDCVYLRKALLPKNSYDVSYKSRIWELSQNVHMTADKVPFGIAPCQTPGGIPFLSDRGAPLSGYDTLSLQGIPIDRIRFTTETNRQLQDLAGNAMSSTVIGCTILAALIVAPQSLGLGSRRSQTVAHNQQHIVAPINKVSLAEGAEFIAEHALKRRDMIANSPRTSVQAERFKEVARMCARRCFCEGQLFISKRPIQRCSDCGLTTCLDCGGNPAHNYIHFHIGERCKPDTLTSLWLDSAPMPMRFENTEELALLLRQSRQCDLHIENAYMMAVLEAIRQSVFFGGVDRGNVCKIYYESPLARLELVLVESPVWQLFVKADAELPGNSELRRILQYPVLHGVPDAADIFKIKWSCFIYKPYKNFLSISKSVETIPSWRSWIGLIDKAGQKVPSELLVEAPPAGLGPSNDNVGGKYIALPSCGTAEASLYKRVNNRSDESKGPMFLFLDPDPATEPHLDTFVFSRSIQRLDVGKSRDVLLRIDPAWRLHEDYATSGSLVDERYRSLCASKRAVAADDVYAFQDGYWKSCLSLELTHSTKYNIRVFESPGTFGASVVGFDADCSAVVAIAKVEFNVPSFDTQISPCTLELKVDGDRLFNKYSWLLINLSQKSMNRDWMQLRNLHQDVLCNLCAPAAPQTCWRLVTKKGKAGKGEDSGKLAAYEDPRAAATFERNCKARPPIFRVRVDISNGKGVIRCGVSLYSLAHRAAALVLRAGAHHINISWKITRYNVADVPQLPQFVISNNADDTPFTGELDFNTAGSEQLQLYDDQRKSLTWMQAREQDSLPPFQLEEVEESIHTSLGLIVQARAQSPIRLRGGVIADQVSYGKTVVALALIQSEFKVKAAGEITAGFIQPQRPGLIDTQATLIVCPYGMTTQWSTEIQKFLPASDYILKSTVLVVKTIADLVRLTIQDFQRAKVIIVAETVFDKDAYTAMLAEYAGIPEPDARTIKGRVFAAWLDFCMGKFTSSLRRLQGTGVASFKRQMAIEVKAALSNADFKGFVSSKRYRGAQYARSQRESQAKAENEAPVESDDTMDVVDSSSNTTKDAAAEVAEEMHIDDWERYQNGPLFHMFQFNRIIVDEFTYVKDKVYECIRKLNADKKWILSGTPEMGNFHDIQLLAELIGVHLGVNHSATGMISQHDTKRWLKEHTDAEKFRNFNDVRSAAWHEQRHVHAQHFLDVFARRNDTSLDKLVTCKEQFIFEDLEEEHLVIYLELVQICNIKAMSHEPLSKHLEGDRERGINMYMRSTTSSEEALVNCALYHRRFIRETQFDELCRLREDEKRAMLELIQERLEAAESLHRQHVAQVFHDAANSPGWRLLGRGKKIKDTKPSEARTNFSEWKTQMCRTLTIVSEWEVAEQIRQRIREVEARANRGQLNAASADAVKASKTGGKFTKRQGSETSLLPQINELSNELSKLSLKYMSRVRALRFVRSVRTIQLARSKADWPDNVACSAKLCRPSCDVERLVLPGCGHIVCQSCISAHDDCTCPVHDCNAIRFAHGAIRASQLAGASPGPDSAASSSSSSSSSADPIAAAHVDDDDDNGNPQTFGAKLNSLAALVDTIPAEDRILIFAQNDALVSHVSVFLTAHGLSHYAITGKLQAADVEKFKQTGGDASTKRIMVLSLTSDSAAGLNLTCANHIVLLSPLLARTRAIYDATMTQAVGRARRYGQRKPVHVYRFVALRTIDVDVLEQRERRYERRVHRREAEWVPYDDDHHRKGDDGGGERRRRQKRRRCKVVEREGLMMLEPVGEGGGRVSGEEGEGEQQQQQQQQHFGSLVKFSRKYGGEGPECE